MTRRRWIAPSLTALAVAAAVVFRLIPYTYRPPNVTPTGGLSLYGGGRLPWWAALLLPLAVMVGTDLILHRASNMVPFHPGAYAGVVGYVLLGTLLRTRRGVLPVAAATLAGSLQFYVVSNFVTWLGDSRLPTHMYPPTLAGLIDCYVQALPFLGYTATGDALFAGGLFAAEAVAERATAEEPAAEEA